MYVLIDLEWVEKYKGNKSVSQIAMIRVDEKWQAVDRFYSRVAPKDYTFRIWDHIGYTGGTPEEFMQAPYGYEVFEKVSRWLKKEDVLCWWYGEVKDWFSEVIPTMANQSLVLSNYVPAFMDGKAEYRGNAYRVGENLGIPAPGQKHFAKADAEMMRLVLEKLEFPQPIPHISQFCPQASRAGALQMAYVAHVDSNLIHKNGCEHIPEEGQLKGYNELKKPIGKGYHPCDCMKEEFRAARRDRNEDIIGRTQYSYLYSPNSKVFHRRGCKAVLSAVDIMGSVYYSGCASTGRHPCKRCNPSPLDHTWEYVRSVSEKKPVTTPKNPLHAMEQRAINRHRQATSERKAVESNPHLSKDKKDSLYTLTTSSYAFFAAKGYHTFHLRNCKKLSGLANLEGFALFYEASRAGYRPCKCCRPSGKHDIRVSLPIYTKQREDDGVEQVKRLCEKHNIRYSEENGLLRMETSAGIWRLNPSQSPYTLEHINLTKTPGNFTKFHKQPRLFLSLSDAFYYIKRHDEGLNFIWKGTEYMPVELAL